MAEACEDPITGVAPSAYPRKVAEHQRRSRLSHLATAKTSIIDHREACQ